MKYTHHFSTVATPQSQPIPGSAQVENSAGGYAYQIDPWQRLNRFLIIGAEGGTYYVSEHKLTVDNAQNVLTCLRLDGPRVVKTIVEISQSGRAPKNNPALFALALGVKFGDLATRQAAYNALPDVARTGTHLFYFLSSLGDLKGWSGGLRRAVSKWYNQKDPAKLVYQLVKYRDREGYTHKDALIQAHPVPADSAHNVLYNWVVNGQTLGNRVPSSYKEQYAFLDMLWGYEQAKVAEVESEIVSLIHAYDLPWEAIDTKWLGAKNVWEALLPNLPLTATLRNLGRMGANGLLAPFSEANKFVCERILNAEALKKARVHPIQILSALRVYAQGHGLRGSLEWKPVPQIIDALNDAFYLAFDHIEPTGKNIVLALDVSGSMDSGEIVGIPGLTPRETAACLALVTANVEPNYTIVGFSHQLVTINITPKMRLDTVIKTMQEIPYGGTDCALPMMQARGYVSHSDRYGLMSHRGSYTKSHDLIPVDAFCVYTDSETWYGSIHPKQALDLYCQESGRNAKLVVVGMTATEFSISDGSSNMMDVVGMDAATPQFISDFIQG